MADAQQALIDIVAAADVLTGDDIGDDYVRDEALTSVPSRPDHVVRPGSTDEVARLVTFASEQGIPVTARGSGTGLSGGCVADRGGILVSFERMDRILEIDTENHVAVVRPGVTLAELDEALAEHGLAYTVYPGEYSASLGGNVATNAGGIRAVKYGVTRHQVLGLEAVLGTGEVIRTGGKYVKATTGYDLTQLIIGSEGTLALATEVLLKLHPRIHHHSTVLAPFRTLDEVAAAVPAVVNSGVGPVILEYIDLLSMAGIAAANSLDLGVPKEIQEVALAYLVVVLEQRTAERLDDDVEELATQLATLGALDVYVLPSGAGAALIEAREHAFWAAKGMGANDIVDMVVPRAQIPQYMEAVAEIAQRTGSLVAGCGHVGDGNVHLSVFQGDADLRDDVMHSIFAAGMELGGAISGEHGIGTAKKRYFRDLTDPTKLALMARIKTAFDPAGILNPGVLFD